MTQRSTNLLAGNGWLTLTTNTVGANGRFNVMDKFPDLGFGTATQDLEAPYGGACFPVEARLAGRSFVKFHLDVSTGDVLRSPYDSLSGRDWLGFAGITTAPFQAVSPEEQFAEKLHAYALPRVGRENTRVKDLVDLILLIERVGLNAGRLPNAIRETFQRRGTHPVPHTVSSPPPLVVQTVCADGGGMRPGNGNGEMLPHT